jgi:hypothetical protein
MDTFAVYQLRPATGPDGGLAGDARAAARDKAADRRKGVARGKRAFAKEGIDPGDTRTRGEVATRGSRRAATAPAARDFFLNQSLNRLHATYLHTHTHTHTHMLTCTIDIDGVVVTLEEAHFDVRVILFEQLYLALDKFTDPADLEFFRNEIQLLTQRFPDEARAARLAREE